jgi:hypothetical protein
VWGGFVEEMAAALSREDRLYNPVAWNDGQRIANTNRARILGYTIVTKTRAKRMGYRLKRGARPLGYGYFKAPISRDAELYVLEVHCVRDESTPPELPEPPPDIAYNQLPYVGLPVIDLIWDTTGDEPVVLLVDIESGEKRILLPREIVHLAVVSRKYHQYWLNWKARKLVEAELLTKPTGNPTPDRSGAKVVPTTRPMFMDDYLEGGTDGR